MDNKIKVISVVGPTASGKTRLAVEIAKHFNGEVISADSMQIYKDMQIATAKPTNDEMQGIRHHLMDFLPPDKTYSVAMFVDDAKKCINDIYSRGKLPVIAGGTGLYVDSLLNNIKFNEEVRNQKICDELNIIYQNEGIDKLLEILSEFDKKSADRLRPERNPKRIIRAIEFYKTTGTAISEQIENSKLEESPFKAIKIGLNYKNRENLYNRINDRVDLMMQNGLLDEANSILSSELSQTSVKAIGYKELLPYINGQASLAECVEGLKRETRRYAKRQITWFKRDKDIDWLYVDEFSSFDELFNTAAEIINKG